MNCGTPVCYRTCRAMKIKSIPPRTEHVIAVERLGNYRSREYILENDSYIDAILCNKCVSLNIDPKVLEDAVADAWEATWRYEKKDKVAIQGLKEKAKIKIKR